MRTAYEVIPMKHFFTGAILLAFLAFTLPSFSQKASPNFQPVCPNPNSVHGMSTNVFCNPGGDNPGPGNPNPGTTGNLNWANQTNPNYNVYVGGVIDREQVGAAINHNDGKMYVAVASRTNDDGNGHHVVKLYTNSNGENDLTLLGNITFNFPNQPGANAVTALTQFNPKLVFVKDTNGFSGKLYFAVTTDYGITIGYYETGTSFHVISSGLGPAYAAPGLADFGNAQLAVSYVSGEPGDPYHLRLYILDGFGNVLHAGSQPAYRLAFDPGLVMFNGVLYIAAQDLDSHQIRLFVTSDGSSISASGAAQNDTTSTTPSLVVRNGYLYIGFRTNDGDHKFLYKYSNNGGNFTTVDPHYEIGGPPSLVYNDSFGSPYAANYAGYIFNAIGSALDNRPYALARGN